MKKYVGDELSFKVIFPQLLKLKNQKYLKHSVQSKYRHLNQLF